MDYGEFQLMLRFFKTMADENRLRIIGLLSQREYGVGELAETLELTEPTVSHHLTRLRELGLLSLRTSGTNRYYRLNHATLDRLKAIVGDLEAVDPGVLVARQPKPDNSWIDALAMPEADRKVMRDYFAGQYLKQVPTKQKKLLVILRWLIGHFEPGREYVEREVNAIIERVYPDYVTLRRELVDFGFLARAGDGGCYWVAE